MLKGSFEISFQNTDKYTPKDFYIIILHHCGKNNKRLHSPQQASCIIDESLLSSVVKTSWALLTDQVINCNLYKI